MTIRKFLELIFLGSFFHVRQDWGEQGWELGGRGIMSKIA